MSFHIQKILDSNLNTETKYADIFREFPQSIQENAGNYLKMGHGCCLLHPSKFIIYNYTLTVVFH
jgi:hypothetical protein